MALSRLIKSEARTSSPWQRRNTWTRPLAGIGVRIGAWNGARTGQSIPAVLLFIALLLAGGIRTAPAAELLMLEQAGCSWCLRFDREIASIYPKTEQGGIAPIRRVDINEEWPADLDGIARERFTPTFVLMHEGVEYGRLRGYSGDEFFWFLLDEMISKLPPDALTPAPQANSNSSG